MALAAAMALALQLLLPMPQPAAATTVDVTLCHSAPAGHQPSDKHGAPSGQAGCDWCVLCGKLGTAVGPLDRMAGLPQRIAAPVAVVAAVVVLRHGIATPRTGPVGARAPPEIA